MRGTTWFQANVELTPSEPPAVAMRRLFESMIPYIRRLERRGLLERFVFARKSPGLRLRFGAQPDGVDATDEIVDWLNERLRQGMIARWFPSVYEPEVFKLGGPDAMAAVHEYFAADSSSWWQWEKLRDLPSSRIGTLVCSLAVMNDLFLRFLDGPEEVWDVWCHIAALHGGSVRGEPVSAAPARIEHLMPRGSAKERRVLRRYELANTRIARQFQALHQTGKLLYAYRLILPHVAFYHWNRYGFGLEDRQTIFKAMLSAWSPAVHRTALTPPKRKEQ
jgi:thiopeptide-type bacteriocin biosynthesis protein